MLIDVNLKVIDKGSIEFNFKELKEMVERGLVEYKNIVVTENNISECSKTKADLNNLIKRIDDRRIAIKKEFMLPYLEVEDRVKQLVSMVKECSENINVQLLAYENKTKEEKKEKIMELYRALDFKLVSLDKIFDKSWLNKGMTLQKINEELKNIVEKIKNDIKILDNLIKNPLDRELILTNYLNTLDLNKAIEQHNESKRIAKIIDESKEEDEYQEEIISIKFEAIGTKEQLNKLAYFMKKENIQYAVIKYEEEYEGEY